MESHMERKEIFGAMSAISDISSRVYTNCFHSRFIQLRAQSERRQRMLESVKRQLFTRTTGEISRTSEEMLT